MTIIDYDSLETHRQHEQKRIDEIKSLSERNRLGQFATPFELARQMALLVAPHVARLDAPVRFLEPALGTGPFFSALLSVLPQDRLGAASGVELDSTLARAARDLWGRFGLTVIEGDFTAMSRANIVPERANLILTNPPYVRHHHLGRNQKERLQSEAARAAGLLVNGLAGLYVYFVLLAHTWLEEGGVAAWLIPSEWMDVNYGAVLRRYFAEQVSTLLIHRFDPFAVQFDDALVSSVVVVYRKAKPGREHAVRFSFGGSLLDPALVQEVPVEVLRRARKWAAYPRSGSHAASIPSGSSGLLLADLFTITRGIATGANEFFIMRREEAGRLGIPDQCLRPILPSPRYIRETVIAREPDGYPRVPEQRVLLDCSLSEGEVRDKYPALWSYLQTAQERGVLDRYLVRKRTPWYRQEHRKPAPFLCTYIGRGVNEQRPFRFILNLSDAIVPNVYLMLYPSGALAAALDQRPDLYEAVHSLLSGITGDDLRGEGRVYGGGVHKIEPHELGRVSADTFRELLPKLSDDTPVQLALRLEEA